METITFGRRAGPARRGVRARRGAPATGNAEAARADAETWVKGLLDVSTGERPWQIRDELGQSMLDNFGVFRYPDRMEKQVGLIDEFRRRYERGVVIEDKGTVFNSDLTQAIELGYLLDLGACMLQAGLARQESRGAHSRPSDFPERDDENFLKHSITPLGRRRAAAVVPRGADDEVGADGEDVLMRRMSAQSWHVFRCTIRTTEPIELAAGGGMGCPDGSHPRRREARTA